nr:MAG TPA: hypothetical protein [Caudoviricetes sp.]
MLPFRISLLSILTSQYNYILCEGKMSRPPFKTIVNIL